MFSTTPTTWRSTFSAIAAARCATRCAAGCGVATTSTSARGRNAAIDSEMSPGPAARVRRVHDLEWVRRRGAVEEAGEGDDLIVVHVADVDVHPLDARDVTDRLDHPAGELGPGGVAGERHGEGHDRRLPVDGHA